MSWFCELHGKLTEDPNKRARGVNGKYPEKGNTRTQEASWILQSEISVMSGDDECEK